MRVPGYRTLRRFATTTRSRLFGRGVILCYHRVAQGGADPWGICVSEKNFAAHLEAITALGTPVALTEMVRGLKEGKPMRRFVAVTFDDGYVDNLTVAAPLLRRASVPATYFISTGFLGKEFWGDALERMVLGAPRLPSRLDAELNGEVRSWDAPPAAGTGLERLELLWKMHCELLEVGPRLRDHALAQIGDQVTSAPPPDETKRGMTPDELAELAGTDGVEIGSHSVTHPALQVLPDDEQRAEMEESAILLRSLVGRPIEAFSYPHGRLSDQTAAIARDCGYSLACTTTPEGVFPSADLYKLPRLCPGDWDGRRFQRWLSGWLGGTK